MGNLGDHLRGKLSSPASTGKLPPHVVVRARAGTGKTWTIISGVCYTFRKRAPGLWRRLNPGDSLMEKATIQQRAVWDAMSLSSDARTVVYCAFNKSVVGEFESKYAWIVDELKSVGVHFMFRTCHSIGWNTIRHHLGAPPHLLKGDRKLKEIVASLLGYGEEDRHPDDDEEEVGPAFVDLSPVTRMQREQPVWLWRGLVSMANLVRLNLVPLEWMDDQEKHFLWDELDSLAAEYNVRFINETTGDNHKEAVYNLLPEVVNICKSEDWQHRIDYTDMVWLPTVLGLKPFVNDLGIVDEAQDQNRCQQAVVDACARRLVLVGDDKQAIYGFTGAGSDSLPRKENQLKHSRQGCISLPMNTTFRCSKAVVEEAKKIVPDFEAGEDNPLGAIGGVGRDSYRDLVQYGDMILCGINAPLVRECIAFLAQGRRARVLGKNIGERLIELITQFDMPTVGALMTRAAQWAGEEIQREMSREEPNQGAMEFIRDQHQCIVALCSGFSTAASLAGVMTRATTLFVDDDAVSTERITLSTVHKSKGLESNKVFLLQWRGCHLPRARATTPSQMEQEANLLYVAITRAMTEFWYVVDGSIEPGVHLMVLPVLGPGSGGAGD